METNISYIQSLKNEVAFIVRKLVRKVYLCEISAGYRTTRILNIARRIGRSNHSELLDEEFDVTGAQTPRRCNQHLILCSAVLWAPNEIKSVLQLSLTDWYRIFLSFEDIWILNQYLNAALQLFCTSIHSAQLMITDED